MNYKENKDKFVTPAGRRITSGLFFELAREETDCIPHFHLSDWHDVYIASNDPTEYKAAMTLIGDWEHWVFLRTSRGMRDIVDGWARELEIKLRSAAISSMIKVSVTEKGQASAKWLAEAGFKMVDKRKKGAKEEEEFVKKEVEGRVADDMKRLGLSVVAGGK